MFGTRCLLCSLIEHFSTLRRNLLTSILRVSFHEDGGNRFLRNVVFSTRLWRYILDSSVSTRRAASADIYSCRTVQLLLTFTAAELCIFCWHLQLQICAGSVDIYSCRTVQLLLTFTAAEMCRFCWHLQLQNCAASSDIYSYRNVQVLLTFTAAEMCRFCWHLQLQNCAGSADIYSCRTAPYLCPGYPSYSCTMSLIHCCAQSLWFSYKGTRLCPQKSSSLTS